ncbi:MAG: hypothetical protein LAN62_05310 [Acidobacteriia bacterium]|nr:hypothetical protein [Terriglobia bacterium]
MALRSRGTLFCGLLAVLLAASGSALGREEAPKPQFKYAAGTESLSEGCEGNLEVGPEGLTFKCVEGEVTAPFSSISLMQYRSDVSKKVRRLKVPWKVQPDYQLHILYGKRNRFFSVVYRLGGTTHVMVLQVPPQAMRPYLAEIDLRAQKRVEVQSYEEY